jgi:hypothetical protein
MRSPFSQSPNPRIRQLLASFISDSLAILGALLMLGNPASADAPSGYICIPDKSTGFAYDKTTHQWDYARFRVDGKKYLLSKKASSGWTWTEFGVPDSFPLNCSNINEVGFIFCQELLDIRINTKKLRYQIMYAIGYIGTPEGNGDPAIEIGTCSPL